MLPSVTCEAAHQAIADHDAPKSEGLGRETAVRARAAPAHNRMTNCSDLTAVVAAQSARACAPGSQAVADAVALRFGDSLDALLFYGSCLRSADLTDGVVDVYALVDSYRHAYRQRYLRWFNRILPPNVFFLERQTASGWLRIKCTVLSLAAFEHGVSHWFQPYLWGRFAQPVRILAARDRAVRARVEAALAAAVITFQRRVVACLDAPFSAESLWIEGLHRTYRTELRVEGGSRARELVAAALPDYEARTAASAATLGLRSAGTPEYYAPVASHRAARRARLGWTLRSWQGRLLSIPRLAKCAVTFRGSIDYAAWKIERHTGIHVDVTPQLRRHPLLYAWPVMARLVRNRVLH